MSTQLAVVAPTVGAQFEIREIPRPTISDPLDILVRVKAASVNPVDNKVRNGLKGDLKKGDPFPGVENKVVGYDAAGIVEAVGSSVTDFKVGDEVFYAGTIVRQGSYQQYQLVDSRLVGRKPKTLSWEQAAALPLTSITAWEGMKELLQVQPGEGILITAGAGGVGSIAIQLAKHWGMSPVIATASRPDTIEWVKSLGAEIVIDHTKGIANEFKTHNIKPVPVVFNAFGQENLVDLVDMMPLNGRLLAINGNTGPDQIKAFGTIFVKRIRLYHEYMFSRSQFGFDQQFQGNLLNEVSSLIDSGKLKSTVNLIKNWREINEAFKIIESKRTIGKIALTIE